MTENVSFYSKLEVYKLLEMWSHHRNLNTNMSSGIVTSTLELGSSHSTQNITI